METTSNKTELEATRTLSNVEGVGEIVALDYLSYLPTENPEGFEESACVIREALSEAVKSDKDEMSVVTVLKKKVYQPLHHFIKENATEQPFFISATRAVIQLGMDKLVAGVDKAATKKGAKGTIEREVYDKYVKDAYYIVLNFSEYAIDDQAKHFLKKYEEQWKQEVEDQYYEGETQSSDYQFTNNKTADMIISAGIYIAITVVIEVICLCFGFYLGWPVLVIA